MWQYTETTKYTFIYLTHIICIINEANQATIGQVQNIINPC